MDNSKDQENEMTFNDIICLLNREKIKYNLLVHEPVRTSEQSAQIRGVSLASGAKAMLIIKKNKNQQINRESYILAVMSAEKRFSWKLIRQELSCKTLDLATSEQVKEITNCITGAVPPFGSIFGIKTITDLSLIDQGNQINFNAGLRTHSICMSIDDYLQIEKPSILRFTE